MSSKWKSAVESLPDIFKYILVLGVVVFITFLFPDHTKFKYHFELGKTWQYEDLVSPFDYAIKKPQAEIDAEIAALEKGFAPYYQLDKELPVQEKEAFKAAFGQQLDTVRKGLQFEDVLNQPGAYLNFGNQFLDWVYQYGIIELEPAHEERGEDLVINLVDGNSYRELPVSSFLTPEAVRSKLTDTLFSSMLAESEFLYPVLEEHLTPNITFNDTLTGNFRQELLEEISSFRGRVQEGELIIPENGMVTEDAYQKLVSLKEQYEEELIASKSRLTVIVGYFLLIGLIIGIFLIYLARNADTVFHSLSNMIFVFLWIVTYSYLVYWVEQREVLSAYLIPFCIVPIVIKTFFTPRLALNTHIVIVLIASFMTSLSFEFAFLQILAGIVVLLSNVDTRDWTQFFYAMFFIFLAYGLGFLGLSLIQEGDIQRVEWATYTWFFLNVFLTLLAIPLIPLLERFFGFTSSITLVELSDMNRPLLRELALKAPGTLQHSLQVANLAEAAARQISADPLLVKVAALYHDVGKTINPAYFIENQSGKNPHEEIPILESVRIIIGHVTEGVKMGKKYRLPKVLIDFIRTHHGTTRVEYFFRNYLKENPEVNVDPQQFRYPGPRPRTKEETILMMADSIEAACKSLKEPTEKGIDELIDKIISGKIAQEQFKESMMTFQELEECKAVFKQIMKSVHHVRIEYPKEAKAEGSGHEEENTSEERKNPAPAKPES